MADINALIAQGGTPVQVENPINQMAKLYALKGAQQEYGMNEQKIAEQNEQKLLLRRALLALPAEQREVILLRDYHHLSYAEIATVLGSPTDTIMSRLHRARSALRERMKQYEE